MTGTSSRSSSTVPKRGSQDPTKLVVPDFETSDWERCHAINAAGGIEMLEWQDGIMRGWLGKNALGRWSASTCGGSLSRQNGKSLGLVVPRMNYGMLNLTQANLISDEIQDADPGCVSTASLEELLVKLWIGNAKSYRKTVKN